MVLVKFMQVTINDLSTRFSHPLRMVSQIAEDVNRKYGSVKQL